MSVTAAVRRAGSLRLPAAAWPLADQGLVSVGGFVVNLTLARGMAPADYGVYCLLFMAMLQVQVVSGSLLFYPLSVRGTLLNAAGQAGLFGTGLLLVVLLCVPLDVALAAGLWLAGHAELAVPAAVWLVLWQVQELLRRGLFTQMRHAAAIPGDALRYGGQAFAMVGLAASGHLTLVNAFSAMAAAAGAAALYQGWQFRLAFTAVRNWRAIAAGCFSVGYGSLGSNLLSTLSLQVYPWCLVLLGGALLAAQFQAAFNVVMVVNPVLIGLCNVIPQVVARECRKGGARQAWRVSRLQMMLGAAPVFAFYGLSLLWPEPVLAALYGHASPYAALTFPVRIMAAAAILGFGTEMVNAYLHGLQRTRLSMGINAAGLAVAACIGVPLTVAFGVAGGCLGMACANIARVAVAARVLSGVLADVPNRRR